MEKGYTASDRADEAPRFGFPEDALESFPHNIANTCLIAGQYAELEPFTALLPRYGDLQIRGGAYVHPGIGTLLAALDLVGRDLPTLIGHLPFGRNSALAQGRGGEIPRLSRGASGPISFIPRHQTLIPWRMMNMPWRMGSPTQ